MDACMGCNQRGLRVRAALKHASCSQGSLSAWHCESFVFEGGGGQGARGKPWVCGAWVHPSVHACKGSDCPESLLDAQLPRPRPRPCAPGAL